MALAMALLLLAGSTALAYNKLEKGMEGPEVAAMQQALKDLGYSIKVDGKYGTDTVAVVRSFQRQHGLTADGVAGDKTLTLLYSLVSANAAVSVTPSPAPVTTPAASGETATVYTTGGSLNLRQGMSASAKVLTTIPFGAEVTVLQRGNNWCTVVYNGIMGYAMTQFLRFSSSSPVATATPVPTQTPTAGSSVLALVTGGDLNLRTSASTSSKALMSIPNGSWVTVTAKGDVWSAVSFNGYSGYVMSQFLTFGTLAPSAVPTAQPTAAPTLPPAGGGERAIVTTTGGSLNLRASANSGAKVLTTIPNGTEITVVSRGTVWCAVNYYGLSGYVMTSFLRFIGSDASASPVPTATVPIVTAAPVPTFSAGETAYVTTSGGSLNLRQWAGSTAKVLTVIPNGTPLTVLSRGSTWCAVTYNGIAGYVMTSFLRFPAASATATPTAAPVVTSVPDGGNTAYVTTSGGSLNLRAAAQSNAKVLTTIPNGTLLTVTARGVSWCAVNYRGYAGYVMTSFLTFTGTPQPTVTPTLVPASTPTSAPTRQPDTPGGTTALVTTSGGTLNLRAAASTTAKVMTSIPNATQVSVLSRGEEWSWIVYNGLTGYVMTRYLTFIGSSATPAPQDPEDDDPSVYTRTLKKGMTGADVSWVQSRLIALGYALSATDVYDDATFNAVKAFQKQNALSVDGYAGSQTFALLKSSSARRAEDSPLTYSSLSVNDSGSEVNKLQTDLKALGYPVKVNGSYDVDTHNAVVAFQQRNGLVISGIADALTRTVLHSGNGKPYSTPVTQLPAQEGWIEGPAASEIQLLHWVNDIKPTVRAGQSYTIFDPNTHLSWKLVFYSLGRHADSQPATWRDTQIMNRSFGSTSWTIHPVYVQLPSGTWTIATMHNRPHLYGSILDNGFGGHLCVHFLRDMAEAQQNDPDYGVNNQVVLRNAWKALTGETIDY